MAKSPLGQGGEVLQVLISSMKPPTSWAFAYGVSFSVAINLFLSPFLRKEH